MTAVDEAQITIRGKINGKTFEVTTQSKSVLIEAVEEDPERYIDYSIYTLPSFPKTKYRLSAVLSEGEDNAVYTLTEKSVTVFRSVEIPAEKEHTDALLQKAGVPTGGQVQVTGETDHQRDSIRYTWKEEIEID